MWKSQKTWLPALALMLVATGVAADPAQPSRTIRVNGHATVSTAPDRVEMVVVVVSRASSASRATADNARAAQAVLSAVRSELGGAGTTATTRYTVQSEYAHPEPGKSPSLTGFRAEHYIGIETPDITRAGRIVDAAIRAGADRVHRIDFTLRDEAAARARALREAVTNARWNASAIASALGTSVRAVHSIDATEPIERPMYEARLVRASSTPITPGAIETTASVTLTVDIGEQHAAPGVAKSRTGP